MKYLFSILFLLILHSVYSQDYFHNTYDNAIACRSIIEVDSGYVVVGGSKVNLRTYINISYIDSIGELQISKNYGDSLHFHYHGLSNALTKTSDGGFALAGSKIRISDEAGGTFLLRFDENLDTLWSKTFLFDTFQSAAYQCKQTNDNGFIIVGARDLNAVPHLEILLIKTDLNGNIEWEKQYGDASLDKTGTRVLEAPDGGYLIGGWIGDNSKTGSGDWYILKVDSLGNFEWDRSYGSEDYNDYEVLFMEMTHDSCYLLSGYIVKSSTSGMNFSKGRIIKIDSLGETIWDKEYDQANYEGTAILAAIELDNHDILAVGNYQESDFEATLFRLTPDGDTIWRRTFDYGLPLDGSLGYIPTIIQTRDKGFALAGYGMFSDLVPSQQMWVIKTDSCGYDVPGFSCGGTVVAEIQPNESGGGLYPNPASKHVKCSASWRIKGQMLGGIQIYDIQGRKRIEIRDFDLEGEIDVSGLECGIYFVRFVSRSSVFTEKLIIRR